MAFVFVLNGSQPDPLFSSKIQSLCPTITGDVCCTEEQFETLRAQVQQVSMCNFTKEIYSVSPLFLDQ